jgi:hypothetical protein
MGKTAVLLLPLLALSCTGQTGDPNSTPAPTVLGSGNRIRDVADPASAAHPMDNEPNGPHPTVNITGAALLWIDTYDETSDGKSIGTVYIQDVGSNAPFSGMSAYKPAYVPADLRVAPGDVLDFRGWYQELIGVGTAKFNPGQVLPQLAKPVSLFRYEYQAPTPTVIDPTDLNDYTKGRKWESMLVTVTNVTLFAFTGLKGRVTGPITADTSQNAVTVSNELVPIAPSDPVNNIPGDYPPGTKFASVTGIVTWFFSYHIAPRTKADLVVAQ